MSLSTENRLLKGARAYDLATLGEIYDQYSPRIYRYAYRLLGDECLAEDCTSETFSRFLKALRIGQGPQNHLQAYLFRIAHNWITDSYRRQPLPPLELNESIQADTLGHPEAISEEHLEQERVRMAMRTLTPDQRQVISLRFLEDWDLKEVSAALGKPIGAIKALQYRATKALEKQLLDEKKVGSYES
ncbi:MAG: RNA polymerase sigma factor [Anaerolineaceae bacterium]